MPCLDPATLQTWLEWAGARLIAMPGPRTGPKEPKGFWPAEFSQELFQVLEFRKIPPIRAGAPSSTEIPIMEEILLLPNICTLISTRRILHARALIHPIRGTHLFSWEAIAKKISKEEKPMKSYTVKYAHKKGLIEVCKRADPSNVCHILQFFQRQAA